MRPFDRSEHLERIGKTQRSMAERGIDVLLSTNPANMNYLSGYDGWSFYVHQLLIVSLAQEEPIWIGREMDLNGARVTTILKRENIIGYPDDFVQATTKHPMDFVAAVLKQKGWDRSTIGVEMDTYYFTAACHESLKLNLPNARFKDASTLVNWVRVIKSPQEVEYMRHAARILEKTMQTGIDMVRPGVRQCDAVAAIYQAQISGTPEYGGDYTGICPMLPTGIGTSTPHLTWTDAPFVRDETTILELAAARHHYHCPMARTVHLGKPPQRLTDTAAVVVEGIGNALEAVRSGVTCEEVDEAWRKVIRRHGIVKESRIGYSTGLNYPPDWGESTISLRPGDRTVLQENMTLHLIAGIWKDDWGIEISECFRVTDKDAECFADFPRRLFVKD